MNEKQESSIKKNIREKCALKVTFPLIPYRERMSTVIKCAGSISCCDSASSLMSISTENKDSSHLITRCVHHPPAFKMTDLETFTFKKNILAERLPWKSFKK